MFWWNLVISITVLLAVNYAAMQYASARQERKETWRPTGPEEAANCEQLRKNFENREAIYIEQGALRVRVKNIQPNLRERYITAEVEEIPTPGLPGLLPRLPPTIPARFGGRLAGDISRPSLITDGTRATVVGHCSSRRGWSRR